MAKKKAVADDDSIKSPSIPKTLLNAEFLSSLKKHLKPLIHALPHSEPFSVETILKTLRDLPLKGKDPELPSSDSVIQENPSNKQDATNTTSGSSGKNNPALGSGLIRVQRKNTQSWSMALSQLFDSAQAASGTHMGEATQIYQSMKGTESTALRGRIINNLMEPEILMKSKDQTKKPESKS